MACRRPQPPTASSRPPPHYRCAAHKDQKRTQQHFGPQTALREEGFYFEESSTLHRVPPISPVAAGFVVPKWNARFTRSGLQNQQVRILPRNSQRKNA